MQEPIFFAWTRSFWLGLFPALLTAFDLAVQFVLDPVAGVPVANFVAWAIGAVGLVPGLPDVSLTPESVQRGMQVLAAFNAILVGQQRSGAARPYTIDPRARR